MTDLRGNNYANDDDDDDSKSESASYSDRNSKNILLGRVYPLETHVLYVLRKN